MVCSVNTAVFSRGFRIPLDACGENLQLWQRGGVLNGCLSSKPVLAQRLQLQSRSSSFCTGMARESLRLRPFELQGLQQGSFQRRDGPVTLYRYWCAYFNWSSSLQRHSKSSSAVRFDTPLEVNRSFLMHWRGAGKECVE